MEEDLSFFGDVLSEEGHLYVFLHAGGGRQICADISVLIVGEMLGRLEKAFQFEGIGEVCISEVGPVEV